MFERGRKKGFVNNKRRGIEQVPHHGYPEPGLNHSSTVCPNFGASAGISNSSLKLVASATATPASPCIQ